MAGKFSKVYSSFLEAPEHFFFMAFLTCLGHMLAGRLTLASEIGPQPRLYTILLGESADDRKSTVLNKTIDFFQDFFKNSDTGFPVSWGIGSAEGLQKRLNTNNHLYRVNGKKSMRRAELSLSHLGGFFGGMKAINITTDKIREYILKRQEEGIENGTINRELSALKRMFNLAKQMTPPKAVNIPYVPHLEETNVREGYFEHQEYLALRKALPAYLKPVVTAAYYTGMRKEEILGLQWPQVDLMDGKIVLRAEDTKTKESRVIFMEGELLEVIHFQRALRDSKFPDCPWVFFDEEGKRIGEFRKSWKSALIQSGLGVFQCRDCETLVNLPKDKKRKDLACTNCKGGRLKWAGKIFHDFRRTAVRNMVRAGVPERVAMMISGHKTRSVFERYNIVNEEDLRKASQKVSKYHRDAVPILNGHNLGTIEAHEAEPQLEGQTVVH